MVWTMQPQRLLRLKPEWRKIIGFISVTGQSWRQDLISGLSPVLAGLSPTTILFQGSPYGLASVPQDSHSGYQWSTLKPIANMGDGYAMLHVAAPISESLVSRAFVVGDETTNGNTASTLTFNSNATQSATAGVFSLNEYSGGFKATAQSNTSMVDGKWHVFLANRPAGNSAPKLYLDGVDVTGSSVANAGTAFSANIEVHCSPVSNANGSRFPSTVSIVFNRPLLASEIAQFRNPNDVWSIFQDIPARIYSFATSTNISVTLTGQQAQFTAGTITPAVAVALTGQQANFTAGIVTYGGVVITLTGQQSQFTAGTIVPALSLTLAGQLANFTAGTITPTLAPSLTGQQANFATGTITYSSTTDVTVSLTGQQANFTAGTLVPALGISLTGQLANFSAGNISYGGDVNVSLTGQQAVFTAGNVSYSGPVPPGGPAIHIRRLSRRRWPQP